VPPPTTCTSFTYSAWGACQSSNTRTRTVTARSPSGCTGGSPVTSEACTYVPPATTCTSFTYSAWGACQPSNTQSRTITGSSPAGCTGGTPVLSQACTYAGTGGIVYPPETTMLRLTQPALSQPALGASVRYTDLGTTVTRATNRLHHYPKNAVWNSDETFALVGPVPGTYTSSLRYLIDGRTYADIKDLYNGSSAPWPSGHRTWANSDPRYIYGVNGTGRQWIRVDVTTTPATRVALKTYTASDVGLSSLNSISYGLDEGNMDNGDTGAVLVAAASGTTYTRPFVIDPKTGAVRCYVTGGGGYGRSVSDATMSQDGTYFTVNWSGWGVDVYRASTCTFVRHVTDASGHYDTCVSTAGEQVVVHSNGGQQPRMSSMSGANLAGASSHTVVVYGAESLPDWHVSCRNTKRPGWAYVSNSNYNCGSAQQGRMSYHRVFAVKLDGSQRIENYAWDHQACPASEAGVTFAAPSRWGNRVWWKANWDGSASLASYVAQQR
jgi:hypothetical protein